MSEEQFRDFEVSINKNILAIFLGGEMICVWIIRVCYLISSSEINFNHVTWTDSVVTFYATVFTEGVFDVQWSSVECKLNFRVWRKISFQVDWAPLSPVKLYSKCTSKTPKDTRNKPLLTYKCLKYFLINLW